MTLPVRLQLAAQAEYDAAADWYEAKRSGLGLRFVAAVEQMLSEVAEHPTRWPEVLPGLREVRVPKWPYCIYYEVHSDHLLILAVFHGSRDPEVWRSRT